MLQELEEKMATTELSKLRIDIGLSHCPPNTTLWLNDCKDTFIIAVEPVKLSFELSEACLRKHKDKNNNTLVMLNCALDNIKTPTKMKMNITATDVGCSSLFEISLDHPYSKLREEVVDIFPFSSILSKIDWKKFKEVEYLKIDTQGKDLNIMKNAKDFHSKFPLIEIESSTGNEYIDAPKQEEILDYMKESGFKFIEDCPDGRGIDKMFSYEGFKNV